MGWCPCQAASGFRGHFAGTWCMKESVTDGSGRLQGTSTDEKILHIRSTDSAFRKGLDRWKSLIGFL